MTKNGDLPRSEERAMKRNDYTVTTKSKKTGLQSIKHFDDETEARKCAKRNEMSGCFEFVIMRDSNGIRCGFSGENPF